MRTQHGVNTNVFSSAICVGMHRSGSGGGDRAQSHEVLSIRGHSQRCSQHGVHQSRLVTGQNINQQNVPG